MCKVERFSDNFEVQKLNFEVSYSNEYLKLKRA